MHRLEETFNNIIQATARNVGLTSKLSEDEKLLLYKYYKQATAGDCSIEKPDIMDYEDYVKWRAWMGGKGMSKDDAMKAYIQKYNMLLQLYCLAVYFDTNDSL